MSPGRGDIRLAEDLQIIWNARKRPEHGHYLASFCLLTHLVFP
ncbi:MAG: hypothetical protein AAFO75_03835 [Pseudomonadota bacterium]